MEIDYGLFPAIFNSLHHLQHLNSFRSWRLPPSKRFHRLLEPPICRIRDRSLDCIRSQLVVTLFHVENLHFFKKLFKIISSLSLPLPEELLHPISHTVSFCTPHAWSDRSLCPQMLNDEKRSHMLASLRINKGLSIPSENPILVDGSFRIELLQQRLVYIGNSINTNLNPSRSNLRMFLSFLHEVVYIVNWLRKLFLLMIDHHFLLRFKRPQKTTPEQPN